MAIWTIECRDEGCGYCTDIETSSETNPRFCPRCGGELFVAGMPEILDEALENLDREE